MRASVGPPNVKARKQVCAANCENKRSESWLTHTNLPTECCSDKLQLPSLDSILVQLGLASRYRTMQDHLEESPCVHVNSIKLMAEAAGIAEPSMDAAAIISEEVTLRLRQIITRAFRFTRHSNRDKLTCADINKSLRWSDCQPVFGYESNPRERMRYSYLPTAQVFKYEDETIDLIDKYRPHASPNEQAH